MQIADKAYIVFIQIIVIPQTKKLTLAVECILKLCNVLD